VKSEASANVTPDLHGVLWIIVVDEGMGVVAAMVHVVTHAIGARG
jgi:hypothetical protein